MKVITIDFDIIMRPSINAYNNLSDDATPYMDALANLDALTNLPFDSYIYADLTKYVTHMALTHPDRIHFIGNHKHIENYITNKMENVELINIDHHHDVGYLEIEDWDEPVPALTCGNWVKDLWDRGILSKYTWIRNDNSVFPPDEAMKYISKDQQYGYYNYYKEMEHADLVIICGSLEWVPPTYHGLYYMWQVLCEELGGKIYADEDIGDN